MKAAVAIALASTACVTMSASMMIGPAIVAMVPSKRVEGGTGDLAKAAHDRLAARKQVALAEATRDALAAADAAPADLRLQRRAAAMVRSCAGDSGAHAHLAELAPHAAATLEHLVATAPCPGLADVAATWLALGDSAKGGEAYVAAATQCDSPEAAIAAVVPLRAADKCDEAIAALRAMWPKVHGARATLGIALLDGVTACSDALTLRKNLAFVPADVMADYFALLQARRREAREAERRAEVEREREAAQEQASAASSQCRSECSAAVSSCEASCQGDGSCLQRCSSVGHVCNSGCGSY